MTTYEPARGHSGTCPRQATKVLGHDRNRLAGERREDPKTRLNRPCTCAASPTARGLRRLMVLGVFPMAGVIELRGGDSR